MRLEEFQVARLISLFESLLLTMRVLTTYASWMAAVALLTSRFFTMTLVLFTMMSCPNESLSIVNPLEFL